MRRAFWIANGNRVIESHDTLNAASRAFWILTAHEMSNRRPACLTLHGGGLIPWGRVTPPLPSRCVEILENPPVVPGGES